MSTVVISRVRKTILNARINTLFYACTLVLSFYSRRIFLESLGSQFLGLTGTMSNLMGVLNLAEMGIGTAIAFTLYKPLYENNRTEIIEIVSVLGYLYQKIGYVILAAGVILSCFLPFLFSGAGIALSVVIFAYYGFLISALLGYFINYREILLVADQRNYVVTAYFQTANIVKVIIQILCAYYTRNYYVWIVIEILFGILFSLILNWKIKQVYPWLKHAKNGRILYQKYNEIGKKTKQLFIQSISDFTLYSTKDLIIYAFTSLTVVAYYGNYTTIVLKLNQLLVSLLTGMRASIGNLIAENNSTKTIRVFWEVMALRYFSSAVFVFSLYHLIEPFISLWLGKAFLLKKTVLVLILSNFFLMQVRGVAINFLQGYGLFGDIAAPIIEAILTLGISITLGHFYGLPGVLVGSISSMFLVGYLWKPFYLFKRGFKKPVNTYWIEVAKYLVVVLSSWWLVHQLVAMIVSVNPYQSFLKWAIYGISVVMIYCIVLGVMMSVLKGMRDFIRRIISKF